MVLHELNMRKLFPVFIMLIGFSGMANGQTRLESAEDNPLQTRPNAEADLHLSIRILNTTSSTDRYVSFENTTYATRLHLTLELSFTNVGKQPILLYKETKVAPDWAISLTEKSALAQKYESHMTSHYLADQDFRKAGWRDDKPQLDQFLILNPGQSKTLLRPYSFSPSNKNGKKLKKGNYFLQLWVQTWYYYADAKVYRENWRDEGYLWSEVLKPKPVLFEVEDR